MLCVVFKVSPDIIGSQNEKLIIQKTNVTLDIIGNHHGHNPYEIMMDKYDKEEMLSDVREAMLYQLGVDVSCEELNHFFTGKGKAALSGCAEWQQCFAVEKMLEFYYVHARDETLAKQIETMTMLASRGNEHHGYHIVQAFAPDDPLDFDTAHEIGLKFAKYFKGYQCVVVTHMNTAHIHNHIIMNSVNFENGQKFHQSAREMQQAKEYSNQLCREYGLSFTESKADPFRIPAWKKRLCRTIKEAMENCATREEFIAFMAEYGYKVRWEPNQKYITYTTPENVRCRDNKLFDQTLLRSSMEAYFDMGGCEYLESRIDATEYGELLPTVDDAVCGLISILDAMNTGDNDRFHLETLHHSKQEIRRILERGGKIDRTVEYAVDDEDEEYEQYHGFSMRM